MKLLQLNNVEKKVKNRRILDGVSFEIEQGEIVALLGLNGAGKSTLIEKIATVDTVKPRQIFYKGKDIAADNSLIRREIGYVPQEIRLFEELNAKQNLEFWASAYNIEKSLRQQAMDMAVEICMLKEELAKPVRTYSGGMKRRLNMAVAIMHNPALLLLDEPDVGMDILATEKLHRAMIEMNRRFGTTILYATHHLDYIEEICHRYIVMHQGKIMDEQTKQFLQKENISLKKWFVETLNTKTPLAEPF